MKLTVLVDNHTYIDQYYYGEPAVSYYLEESGKRILLDTGYSELFMKNAAKLGVDMNRLDMVVISHGHDDHTGGLSSYFNEAVNPVTLVAHPDAFKEKRIGDLKICSPLSQKELADKCRLQLSKEPLQLSERLWFLGEIPQRVSFEGRKSIGVQVDSAGESSDYVLDDTALAYKGEEGIYIITGCSHSGICNIVEQAKIVCEEERVRGIIGGFHLFEVTEQVRETITYFQKHQITELYPCHCTSFAVRAAIHQVLPVKEVGVGLEIQW